MEEVVDVLVDVQDGSVVGMDEPGKDEGGEQGDGVEEEEDRILPHPPHHMGRVTELTHGLSAVVHLKNHILFLCWFICDHE